MENEAIELSKSIDSLVKILSNESELEKVIINEIKALMEKYPSPRKSVIHDEVKKIEIDEQELIENENVMVVLTRDGYIKRSSLKSYLATQGNTGLKEHDVILKMGEINTRSTLLLFTNIGNFIQLPVHKILDAKWKDLGDYIGNYAQLVNKEKVIDYLVIDSFDDERYVLIANQDGQVKRVLLSDFNKTRINKTFNVLESSLVNPLVSIDLQESFDSYVVLVSHQGYVVKYDIEEIPVQSLMAKGVKGINLRKDQLIGAKFATKINKDELLMLTNRGGLKREFTMNIETSHRPAKGKRYFKLVKTNPYFVVSIACENIFRLKSYINVHLISKKKDVSIPGDALKPDKYENGIPLLEKEDHPEMIRIDINRYQEAINILLKIQDQSTEDEVDDNDDLINELEKIISISQEDEVSLESSNPTKEDDDEDDDWDEDDDEDIIQQKLF